MSAKKEVGQMMVVHEVDVLGETVSVEIEGRWTFISDIWSVDGVAGTRATFEALEALVMASMESGWARGQMTLAVSFFEGSRDVKAVKLL